MQLVHPEFLMLKESFFICAPAARARPFALDRKDAKVAQGALTFPVEKGISSRPLHPLHPSSVCSQFIGFVIFIATAEISTQSPLKNITLIINAMKTRMPVDC